MIHSVKSSQGSHRFNHNHTFAIDVLWVLLQKGTASDEAIIEAIHILSLLLFTIHFDVDMV